MTDDEPTITVSEGGFELPVVEILTGRGVVFGKSGSGKSNSVGVIAEELLEQGFPLCIIDADGEHYGLKEEYELLHVGGDEECDLQVGPEHADRLASVMLTEDIPVILDTSGYIEDSDAHELVEGVISRLFSMEKKTKKPFPVFIEEAHELVPETNHPDSTAKTIIKAAKRGRKHGLGIVASSQRPAEVKKSLATQSSWSVWHKLEWKQDTDVVKTVINREYAEAVQDLDEGEAIVNADWMDDVRIVQFKRKRTFDAGATPGLDEFTTPELKGVSDEIIEQLQSVTDEAAAEESEVEDLRATVDKLEAEKEELERELDRVAAENTTEPEKVEALTAQADRLREERNELQERVDELEVAVEEQREQIASVTDEAERLADERDTLRERIEAARDALGVEMEGADSKMRDRIEELESENQELRQRLESDSTASLDVGYLDFIEQDAVQAAIDDAKAETTPKYVSRLIAAIVSEEGPVTYTEVADQLGLSQTNHISSAATTLEEYGVVVKVEDGKRMAVDLNLDGLDEIVARREKRKRTEQLVEEI